MDNLEQKIPELLGRIPHYREYRSKEDRRDADKRLRDEIVLQLDGYMRQLDRVNAALADRREMSALGPVAQLEASIRLLSDRVRTASYGYGGLFSDRNVDDAALDQLHQFDSRMMQAVQQLESSINAVEKASETSDRLAAIEDSRKVMDHLQDLFRGRSNIVETGRVNPIPPPPSPLEVLQDPKPAEAAARRLPEIKDALSLGGKNYIVDATIDLQGQERMRLARIGVGRERWLLVSAAEGGIVADLGHYQDASSSPAPQAKTMSAQVVGVAGKSGTRQVSVALTRSQAQSRPVRLVIDWGADKLVLSGSEIEYEDIEMYGGIPDR